MIVVVVVGMSEEIKKKEEEDSEEEKRWLWASQRRLASDRSGVGMFPESVGKHSVSTQPSSYNCLHPRTTRTMPSHTIRKAVLLRIVVQAQRRG